MSQAFGGIVPRILRDMNDGVLVLDPHGTILYVNEKAQELLGTEDALAGKKFAAAFLDTDEENDEFNQFILDAVYQKEKTHSGQALYCLPSGEKKYFHMTSSFLMSEDGTENIGVVVMFMDVTVTATLYRQRQESSTIFALLMICVCGIVFLWSALQFLKIEPPAWVMSKMIEAVSIVMFFIILKTTSFSLKDMGIKISNYKDTFGLAALISIGGTAAMVLLKIIMLHFVPDFFPEGAPFWDWKILGFADLIYPFTAVLQEFLARSVMQENLRRIFVGKHADAMSVLVASLVFGALHLAYGLPLMLGASILLGALGMLYNRQRNIWGLSIIHFVLGEAATCLRFLY